MKKPKFSTRIPNKSPKNVVLRQCENFIIVEISNIVTLRTTQNIAVILDSQNFSPVEGRLERG